MVLPAHGELRAAVRVPAHVLPAQPDQLRYPQPRRGQQPERQPPLVRQLGQERGQLGARQRPRALVAAGAPAHPHAGRVGAHVAVFERVRVHRFDGRQVVYGLIVYGEDEAVART